MTFTRGLASIARAEHGRSGSAAFAAALLVAAIANPADAGTRIAVRYGITYLGITIGTAAWEAELNGDHYILNASAQVSGMMSVLINGEGSGRAEGVVAKERPMPASFDAHVASTAETDTIRMTFRSSAVASLSAEPPFPPLPKRVPVTKNLLQDVVDPLSASLLVAPDTGAALGPDTCKSQLPIFDGRRRYNVALAFKRVEDITIAPGYHGAAIVCSVHLFPIAGQQANSSAIKFLVERNDIEFWFASVPDQHIAVPVRATIPTLIGTLQVIPERWDE